jgi:hypothetical protein
MALSFRRWGARQLVLSWLAYWVALVLIGLGPALLAIWRVTGLPEGRGSVSANIGDGRAQLTVIREGTTIWSGSMGVTPLLLLVVGPPLALWIVWLLTRPKREPAAPSVHSSGSANATR